LKKNTFIYGTIILTTANFFVRVLGFVYRILLSRIVGAEGIGIVQLIFPISMLLITIVSSGVPIAVSKLVSEYQAKGSSRGVKSTLRTSFLLVTFLSVMVSFIIVAGGKHISGNIIKEERTYYALMAFVPCILIVGLSSIIRGYYFGIKRASVPAQGQVIEQLVRIPFVIFMLYLFFPLDYKYAAVILVGGMVIGELFELLWLTIKFKKDKNQYPKQKVTLKENIFTLRAITAVALPITFARVISTLIQTANSIMIPQRLQVAGFSKSQSIIAYGKLTGMALPLLFLPFVVTSALAVNVIPNIAESNTNRNWSDVNHKINAALKLTSLIAFPVTIIFFTFPYQIASLVYNQGDVGFYLLTLAFAPIFLSLSHTVSGILQGLGKQMITTRNDILGMSLQLFFTFFLVAMPKIEIYGYILGFIVSNSLILILDFIFLVKLPKIKVSILKTFGMPALAALLMYVLLDSLYNLLMNQGLKMTSSMVLSMLTGTVCYVLVLFVTKTLNPKSFR